MNTTFLRMRENIQHGCQHIKQKRWLPRTHPSVLFHTEECRRRSTYIEKMKKIQSACNYKTSSVRNSMKSASSYKSIQKHFVLRRKIVRGCFFKYETKFFKLSIFCWRVRGGSNPHVSLTLEKNVGLWMALGNVGHVSSAALASTTPANPRAPPRTLPVLCPRHVQLRWLLCSCLECSISTPRFQHLHPHPSL